MTDSVNWAVFCDPARLDMASVYGRTDVMSPEYLADKSSYSHASD